MLRTCRLTEMMTIVAGINDKICHFMARSYLQVLGAGLWLGNFQADESDVSRLGLRRQRT
jgi:hypothetical protein